MAPCSCRLTTNHFLNFVLTFGILTKRNSGYYSINHAFLKSFFYTSFWLEPKGPKVQGRNDIQPVPSPQPRQAFVHSSKQQVNCVELNLNPSLFIVFTNGFIVYHIRLKDRITGRVV